MIITSSTPPLDEICSAVQERRTWGIDTLQQLVAIDSVAPNEQECQFALAEILKAEGLPVGLLPLDDGTLSTTDGFIDSGLPFENRPNLVTSIGGHRDGSRSLIINSHIDTVSWAETSDGWEVHPLSGAIKDGKLFGRGATDAKGQIVAGLVALLALKDLDYSPPGKAIVQSAVGEEPNGNGTLALCAQGSVADAAINMEPTNNHIAYGHRGIIGIRYRIIGEAHHSSTRIEQPNAIVRASRLAQALDSSLEGWNHPTDAEYGSPTINIGRINGGEDIFTTPYRCTLECGIRYAPGTYKAIMQGLNGAMQRELRREEEDLPNIEEILFFHADASAVAADTAFVQTVLAAVNEIDDSRQLVIFPAGCDARHFINRYNMPAVIFGPGDLSLAHAENEYLDLAEWIQASQALALFISRWCI